MINIFDLQKKIYSKINVSAIKTKAKIFDYVPESVRPPYVVIGEALAQEHGTKTDKGWEVTATLYVWGKERSLSTVHYLLKTLVSLLSVHLDDFRFFKVSSIAVRRISEHPEFVQGVIKITYRIKES